MNVPVRLASLLWMLVAAVAQPDEAPLAVPVEGESFRGRLAAADSATALRFVVDDAKRELPLADLVTWGTFVEPAQGPVIVFPGRGLLAADGVQIVAETVHAESAIFGKIELPLDLVAGIVLRPPHDRAAGDKLLARVLDREAQSDRLLLDNGDLVAGTIAKLARGKAALETDAGPVEVKSDALVAVLFDPSLVNRPRTDGLHTVVGFRDGSRLTALAMHAEVERTRIELAGGVTLTAPTSAIVALQVFGGRVTYLSDLEPVNYRHLPYLQLPWEYQTDHSVRGAQLRAAGRLYLKGLGMHSPSRITYDVAPGDRRFEAEVALDDEVRKRGSVVFRVFVDDGGGKWKPVAATEVLRGGDAPQKISVDVENARRISLLVDFADRGDELDHADWLNARFVR
ncbi:MAG: hypothetical protein DWQ37_18315 [Planctomycetota bacterium]|nr:MAG: hypothetical protein DWQ37_18315 [Planctomycetota bacterium]